jgi:predicted DNA-binding transcriptional regulator YafY
MDEVELLDSVSKVPNGFDPTGFADRSFGLFQEPLEDVVLHVAPAVAARATSYRFHPSQAFEAQDDGGLIVRLRAGGMLELCWRLFTWRVEIEILGPETLKLMMAEELARLQA